MVESECLIYHVRLRLHLDGQDGYGFVIARAELDLGNAGLQRVRQCGLLVAGLCEETALCLGPVGISGRLKR